MLTPNQEVTTGLPRSSGTWSYAEVLKNYTETFEVGRLLSGRDCSRVASEVGSLGLEGSSKGKSSEGC